MLKFVWVDGELLINIERERERDKISQVCDNITEETCSKSLHIYLKRNIVFLVKEVHTINYTQTNKQTVRQIDNRQMN